MFYRHLIYYHTFFYTYLQWVHGTNMQLYADFEPLLRRNFPKFTSLFPAVLINILTFQDYTKKKIIFETSYVYITVELIF